MHINIIGGGLAGCALAYILKNAGHEPVIYESGSTLARGASGNDVGLYNPRFSAQRDGTGDFYASAFEIALPVFEKFGDEIDFTPCGALHIITDEKKRIRFTKMLKSWGWAHDDMHIVDAKQASHISGIPITHDCLYLKKSGIISPNKLCHAYAKDIDVYLNTPIHDIADLDGDATVLACGIGCLHFEDAKHLPLYPVRGQITYVTPTEHSTPLKTTLGYGGYMAPIKNGTHCIGSSFERYVTHCNINPDDDAENISKLRDTLPSLSHAYDIIGHRASVRTTSRDYAPVVGQLSDNVYISTAHGSHGILSTLLSAEIISNIISGHQNDMHITRAISPARFD